MWVRGLKRISGNWCWFYSWSHPMWVRGLKLLSRAAPMRLNRSHPMWVRGLKPKNDVELLQLITVAPYVGAWIETTRICSTKCS